MVIIRITVLELVFHHFLVKKPANYAMQEMLVPIVRLCMVRTMWKWPVSPKHTPTSFQNLTSTHPVSLKIIQTEIFKGINFHDNAQ